MELAIRKYTSLRQRIAEITEHLDSLVAQSVHDQNAAKSIHRQLQYSSPECKPLQQQAERKTKLIMHNSQRIEKLWSLLEYHDFKGFQRDNDLLLYDRAELERLQKQNQILRGIAEQQDRGKNKESPVNPTEELQRKALKQYKEKRSVRHKLQRQLIPLAREVFSMENKTKLVRQYFKGEKAVSESKLKEVQNSIKSLTERKSQLESVVAKLQSRLREQKQQQQEKEAEEEAKDRLRTLDIRFYKEQQRKILKIAEELALRKKSDRKIHFQKEEDSQAHVRIIRKNGRQFKRPSWSKQQSKDSGSFQIYYPL